MKIYTKTGDAGETSLFDRTRVSKADARVDAYGEVDELNACLGTAAAAVAAAAGAATPTEPSADADGDLRPMIETIQRALFAVGSRLADPSSRIAGRVTKAVVSDDDVQYLERAIDSLEAQLPPIRRFILPGGSPAGAQLHLARTVCRRAERRVVALGADGAEPVIVVYLNRLSDLLFVMARVANHRAGVSETEW